MNPQICVLFACLSSIFLNRSELWTAGSMGFSEKMLSTQTLVRVIHRHRIRMLVGISTGILHHSSLFYIWESGVDHFTTLHGAIIFSHKPAAHHLAFVLCPLQRQRAGRNLQSPSCLEKTRKTSKSIKSQHSMNCMATKCYSGHSNNSSM